MNRSAIFRCLSEARQQREYAVNARFYEPKAVPDHLRRARHWLEAARSIRIMDIEQHSRSE